MKYLDSCIVAVLALVAPFAGAWIEIATLTAVSGAWRSLPSRERGLKYLTGQSAALCHTVAPFAGAWIEIYPPYHYAWYRSVAPFAGAWIEMVDYLLGIDRHDNGRSLRGSVD